MLHANFATTVFNSISPIQPSQTWSQSETLYVRAAHNLREPMLEKRSIQPTVAKWRKSLRISKKRLRKEYFFLQKTCQPTRKEYTAFELDPSLGQLAKVLVKSEFFLKQV